MSFVPSIQQQNFFNWVVSGEGSCVLEAVAGSGKTTTLINGIELMEGEVFFGAYNKGIQLEIASKVNKSNVNVATMHSAGLTAWKKVAKYAKVDSNKCRSLFQLVYPDYKFAAFQSAVLSLVSYAKQAAFNVTSPATDEDYYELINHFNVDCLEDEEFVVDAAKEILKLSVNQDSKIIDFDDMIYAPLVHGAKVPEYDWVLIDEAQDTNKSRRLLSILMLKRGGRLVAVGDRHQAIYGFTGADSDSLDQIKEAVNAIELPLTVTYRCPKSVVKKAQEFVSHIQAHETAPEGNVEAFKGDIFEDVKAGDVILSRFNKHLVEHVYGFIKKGIAAKIEGREIGTNLKQLVRRYKSKSYSVLNERLSDYCERESKKCRVKGKESQAVAIEDRVDCIKVIMARVESLNPNSNPIDAVCAEIDNIFADAIGNNVILLSTIHKAKGREWNNVYWLQAGPAKWARQAWEKECERNLMYVAATRAKENLYLVPVNKKKEN